MLVHVLILVAVLQLTSGQETAGHFRDTVVINNRTYYFSYLEGNVLDGALICGNAGLLLMSLETVEEHNDVTNFIQNTPGYNATYWTSGVQYMSDWMWSGTGTMIRTAMWDVDEPDVNDVTKQACVLLDGLSGKFNDFECYVAFLIACEQRDC